MKTRVLVFPEPQYTVDHFGEYLENLLQLESIACKDWLTNKVDRCGNRKGLQNNRHVACISCHSTIWLLQPYFFIPQRHSTALGHALAAGLVSPENGSVLSIAEALTNIIWAPIEKGIEAVSLSAKLGMALQKPG